MCQWQSVEKNTADASASTQREGRKKVEKWPRKWAGVIAKRQREVCSVCVCVCAWVCVRAKGVAVVGFRLAKRGRWTSVMWPSGSGTVVYTHPHTHVHTRALFAADHWWVLHPYPYWLHSGCCTFTKTRHELYENTSITTLGHENLRCQRRLHHSCTVGLKVRPWQARLTAGRIGAGMWRLWQTTHARWRSRAFPSSKNETFRFAFWFF